MVVSHNDLYSYEGSQTRASELSRLRGERGQRAVTREELFGSPCVVMNLRHLGGNVPSTTEEGAISSGSGWYIRARMPPQAYL